MKIYNYHPTTKEFLSESTAELSPADLEKDIEYYMIPANATTIEPLQPIEGKTIVFGNNEWVYVDVEVVAQNDIDMTSPSTETAFQKISRLMETMSMQLDEVNTKLAEKDERISLLESNAQKVDTIEPQALEV